MTVPKITTMQRGGSRFYVHPTTRGKVPGVTSVVGMLPKDFLKFWAAKVVAESAVDNLGSVVGLALNDRQGAIDYLKRSPQRSTDGSANVGTEVHEIVERLARGQKVTKVHPDLAPYVNGWREWFEEYEPEFLFMEETVWSETHGYAGSFDWIARIGDDVVIGDYKTTKSGVHAEVATQLVAYKNADYILRPDASQVPIPDITGGAVLHLRPEGWSFVPVSVKDEVFEVFKALLVVHGWDKEVSKSVIGHPLGGRQFEDEMA